MEVDLYKKDKLIHTLRNLFIKNNYFEVQPYLLSPYSGVEAFLTNLVVNSASSNQPLYLPTSPELYLKKIFSKYMNNEKNIHGIFSIANSFRNEILSKHHLYEFTLIEWYHYHETYLNLINNVMDILKETQNIQEDNGLNYKVFTIQEVFYEADKVEFTPLMSLDEIQKLAFDYGISQQSLQLNKKLTNVEEVSYIEWKKIIYFNLLFDTIITPFLKNTPIVFLHEFPYFVRGLATLNNKQLANRVECYIHGVELANGCNEIYSIQELQQVLAYNNNIRKLIHEHQHVMDPVCLKSTSSLQGVTGMALGIERLLNLDFDSSVSNE